MTDLSTTIDPKSDQLNSDDLIAGPRTITVTRVVGNSGKDQPVSIFFEGDNGKPYLPCKSMRRVLVELWGKDGSAYTGRAMTLYRDPKVKFGGIEVGGIRISHLSHIESDVRLMLTSTRGKKDPHSVKKLVARAAKPAAAESNAAPSVIAQELARKIEAAESLAALDELIPLLRDATEQKTVSPDELATLRKLFGAKKKTFEPADF